MAICAVVLASYETLLPFFDNDKERMIRELLQMRRAVLEKPYETIFGGLSRREDGLDKLESACRKEEPFYGASWDIEYARPREDLFEMKVHRCFYRDFFERHDMLLLTTVMCAFDVNFMRAIDPAESGLRAERSSLMSLGDEECRFAVLETDDPKALYSDVLEQRFAESPESA